MLSYFSGPIIGALIGYITNYIAIKMLFRPHKAIYIFGWRLPFTPGIVPRRKNQLAKILGNAIVEKFFNADDLELVFTSGSFADAVAEQTAQLLMSDGSLRSAFEQAPQEKRENLESELCIRIQTLLITSGVPKIMAEKGREMAAQLFGNAPAGKMLANALSESMVSPLSHEIEEYIINDGRALILPLLHSEIEDLSGQPVSALTSLLVDDRETLKAAIKQLYMRFMRKNVRPIVESIDVGGMITDKIILMSSEEVEDLVLTVVSRELHLVVLFGAVLGAVIGVVNIFI